MNNKHQSKIYN